MQWVGTPIPKATLEAIWLGLAKQAQIEKISSDMHIEVTGGFLSDALSTGTFRRYDSDPQGQISIVGALTYLTPHEGITPPESYTLSSVDPGTGIRGYAPHSYVQLYQLLGDLGIFSSALIAKLQAKIIAIMTTDTGNVSNDLDSIYAITWESVE